MELFSKEKTEVWRERLSTVFNRGFWDGYYLGQKMGEWNTNYGSSATKRKIYIGKSPTILENLMLPRSSLKTEILKKEILS